MLSPVMSVKDIELPGEALLRRFRSPRSPLHLVPDRRPLRRGVRRRGFRRAAGQPRRPASPPPLSIYVHVPFCDKVCFYCACNKVVTRHHERAAEYLEALRIEADLVGGLLSGPRELEQLHFGGGTPTFLSNAELEQVMAMLTQRYPLARTPSAASRSTRAPRRRTSANAGAGRLQPHVDGGAGLRPRCAEGGQPAAELRDDARDHRGGAPAGFKSSTSTHIRPAEARPGRASPHAHRVLELSPERIALYHYAHLPERFKPQRRIVAASCRRRRRRPTSCSTDHPAVGGRLSLHRHGPLRQGRRRAGPRQVLGRLHRNFQGYSTRPDCDLIGLGVSSISKVRPDLLANVRELDEYYDAARRLLPTARGCCSTATTCCAAP